MTNIRLIATDMDGTLLNSERKISKANAEAIRYAESKGITVAVATGRDYTEAIAPLKEAGLRLPLICVNGAEMRSRDGQILSQAPLDKTLYNQMSAILREENVYYEMYTTKGSFTENQQKGIDIVVNIMMSTGEFATYDEVMKVAEARFKEGAVSVTDDYQSVLTNDVKIYKLLAFSEDDGSRERAKQRLLDLSEVSVSASASENLEITHLQATKGKALEKLAKDLDVSIRETMALGDNLNDVSMLSIAGVSVAMKNGEDEVKKISDRVTASNVEDGVAKAIYDLIDQ
ncbi:Cof-type HAD-IIB family hydrolase [Alteribacter populi]|uniref:Cof-type HAD-IIB family hydrolase n=1 Tax=Alteribacter populi TaxID=2011011 RepID=UPI001E4CE3F3|nr:Cof-type HAD-IIB family hydrolase [Alteribacter populi]